MIKKMEKKKEKKNEKKEKKKILTTESPQTWSCLKAMEQKEKKIIIIIMKRLLPKNS
ncbi:hypothetical protein RFI_31586 [Reticulomyxa filosa]|uniref:Uncharacterized protein n=1 Tax=Reticulomyxa filosa TaxID=46433 RepID=X6LXE5_RETFI|nr:hypothetical protein RFI_31586 [Reticulomyxa filosa]|eukprot:ETO05812.1 hypothetical protein RFI_31586 [Reticulomyxa filosa]